MCEAIRHIFVIFTLLIVSVVTANQCKHYLEQKESNTKNHFIKNKEFRSIVENYEKFHAKWYKEVKFDTDVINNRNIGDHAYKYLILRIDFSGFGNRMMVLMSSYLVSLLTNRILLIKSPPHFDFNTVLCSPFPDSSWVIPNNQMLEQKHSPRYIKFEAKNNLHLLHSEDFTDKSLDLGSKLIWEFGSANLYWLPMLFLNPHVSTTLNKWFPDHNVSSILAKYLIHPSDSIWKDIMTSYNKKLSNNADGKQVVTIGVQVRWPGIYEQFLNDSCLLYPYNASYLNLLPRPNTDKNNLKYVVVHVASLQKTVAAELTKKYPSWHVYQKYAEVSYQLVFLSYEY